MKKLKAIIAALTIISICALSACADDLSDNSTTAEMTADIVTEETPYTTQATTQTSPEDIAVTAINYSQQEIQMLLTDFGSFCYSYVDGKAFRQGNGYDTSDFITETIIREDGSTYEDIWYRVTDEAVTDYQSLIALGSQYCTEDMLNSIKHILDHNYKEQDGRLYVWQHAGSDGSLMGVDYAYVTSVEQDGWSLIVHMNAFGSKDNWDTEEDYNKTFEVQLTREDGILKVDVCDTGEQDYIAYAYMHSYDDPLQ